MLIVKFQLNFHSCFIPLACGSNKSDVTPANQPYYPLNYSLKVNKKMKYLQVTSDNFN